MADTKTCGRCGGNGFIPDPNSDQEIVCGTCNGTGQVPA